MRRSHEPQVWPRTLVVGEEIPEPLLPAPSTASFGIEHFGKPTIKIALVETFERRIVRDGTTPLPPVPGWPRPTAYAVPPEAAVLPVPAAHNFRYARPFQVGKPEKPKLAAKKPAAKSTAKDPAATGATESATPPANGTPRRPRAVGHQLSVVRPPVNLWPQAR